MAKTPLEQIRDIVAQLDLTFTATIEEIAKTLDDIADKVESEE